jgi:hypothetical protein
MEVFENAAGAGAQLLRVERLGPGVREDDEATPPAAALLFTFDVGRVLLSAEPAHRRLVATAIPDPASIPGGLVDAAEEEPWWRLLGCALSRATAGSDGASLQLEFRISGGELRRLDLGIVGGSIRAALASAPA